MKTSTCRDGILKNKPNKMGTTPQYFHTIPTSCAILQTLHTTKLYMQISLPTPNTQPTHQHGTPQPSVYKTTNIYHTQQQYVKPRAQVATVTASKPTKFENGWNLLPLRKSNTHWACCIDLHKALLLTTPLDILLQQFGPDYTGSTLLLTLASLLMYS